MGLAASQARLLTITSRKSSAQFESMRLSHEKLALSRSLTDVSNEYQNSLKQTKLFYDFYGIGSTDNMLSYSLFMTPSYINDYTPVLLTNRQNRIVLSTSFASAARAAGIPQEGLDGYIDTPTRNRFIATLEGLNEIDPVTSLYIRQTEYNPYVGLGQTTGVYTTTETENYDAFERQLSRVKLKDHNGCSAEDLTNCCVINDKSAVSAYVVNHDYQFAQEAFEIKDSEILRLSDTEGQYFRSDGMASFGTGGTWDSLTLYDILYGEDDIVLTQNVQIGQEITDALNPHQYDDMLNIINNVIGVLTDQLEDTYGLDDTVRMAIAQADANMTAECWNNTEPKRLGMTTMGTDGNLVDTTYYTKWDNNMLITGGYFQFTVDYPSSLNLLNRPKYTYNTVLNEYFTTAEDYFVNGQPQWVSTGYEPRSYWISMPSTVDDNKTKPDNVWYVQPTEDNEFYDARSMNTGKRNAVVYALLGANQNMALINMYDNSDNKVEGQDDAGNFGAINLSKFVQAWYTYFMQALATYKLDPHSQDEQERLAYDALHNNTEINFHKKNSMSTLVTNGDFADALSQITFEKGEVLIDDGIASIASFYDTIINQICEYGWCENNEVKENAGYLQEMLKTGKMFLFKLANDSYYYQTNYATDTFIKEVEDESAIAQAEAKYKTQKARINAKEQEIDIKMKNLDTEISSLETEYEAVKKMISNSQKVFQRYQ